MDLGANKSSYLDYVHISGYTIQLVFCMITEFFA